MWWVTHSTCVPWYLGLQTFLILNHNKNCYGANRMAQCLKALTAPAWCLTLVPRTHVKRMDSTKLPSDIHKYTVVCTHPHTYIMHTYTACAQLKTHICMCSCVQMCTHMCFCGWSPEADVETPALSESFTELELLTLARLADQWGSGAHLFSSLSSAAIGAHCCVQLLHRCLGS